MTESKTKVTLVGKVLARPGLEFVYEGEAAECGTCKVKKACHNLSRGHRYRVVTVRSTHHECPIHLNGATAVDVMEAPVTMLINADMAIVNSKVRIEFSCNKSECKSFALCHPDGVVEGEKYSIVDVLGNASDICEKGRALKLVEIKST